MRSRIFLLGLFVMLSSTLAQADQIPDPIIRTGGSQRTLLSTEQNNTEPGFIITTNFSITSPSGTSPDTSPCILDQGGVETTSLRCLFKNDITIGGVGVAITSLVFDAPSVPFGPQDTCDTTSLGGSPFTMCGVDPLTGGGTEFSFFDGSIPFDTEFALEFDGFPKHTSFKTTATPIPEPATLGLFLTGIAAAFARRRARVKA